MSVRAAAVVCAALLVAGCTSHTHGALERGAPSTTASTSTTVVPTTVTTLPRVIGRVAAPAPSTAGFRSPLTLTNRPTPVAGDTNGEMPARDLVGVLPTCQAARAAAPSLGLLFATARDLGAALGARECYRPLAGQVAAQQHATAAGNSACAASVPKTPSGAPKGTSMHGWGKAGDFSYAGDTVLFGTAGDRFLNAHANRFGWNHPGWARPGGSTCPEAWHWEWVGDGGVQQLSAMRADVVGLLPTSDGRGYWSVTGLGAVAPRGDAVLRGSLDGQVLPWLIVAAVRTPAGGGYWLVGSDGSLYPFGDAARLPAAAPAPAPSTVVAMAPTPDGRGCWLATSDGRVVAVGDAVAHGAPAQTTPRPTRAVTAIAATPTGRGYWVASADGRVFAFGDAPALGDPSGHPLPAPVVATAATPDGRGYWLAGADGSVYAFGDAPTVTGAPTAGLVQPVVAIAATPSGGGFWLAAADGRVLPYGDAGFYGNG